MRHEQRYHEVLLDGKAHAIDGGTYRIPYVQLHYRFLSVATADPHRVTGNYGVSIV